MYLLWYGGSSVHSTTHPWPLIAWTIFWFPILYGLLPLGDRLCLIVDFSSFSLLFCSFCSLATIPAIPLCHSYCDVIWPILARPFSLDLYSCYFGLSCPIILLVGSFVSFPPPWASSTHLLSLGILDSFSNSTFPWAFTNSLGLLWPNYHILHFLDSWVFHQPLTFSFHYFGSAVAHSHFSTSYNAHGFTISFSMLLLGSFASLKAHLLILWAYNPLFILFGFNGSSINPLTHLYLYCWASSYY